MTNIQRSSIWNEEAIGIRLFDQVGLITGSASRTKFKNLPGLRAAMSDQARDLELDEDEGVDYEACFGFYDFTEYPPSRNAMGQAPVGGVLVYEYCREAFTMAHVEGFLSSLFPDYSISIRPIVRSGERALRSAKEVTGLVVDLARTERPSNLFAQVLDMSPTETAFVRWTMKPQIRSKFSKDEVQNLYEVWKEQPEFQRMAFTETGGAAHELAEDLLTFKRSVRLRGERSRQASRDSVLAIIAELFSQERPWLLRAYERSID